MVYQFDKYEFPILLNYLRRSNHYYIDRQLPEIILSMQEVYYLYPALSAFKNLIHQYTKRLQTDFEKEKRCSFPMQNTYIVLQNDS